MHAPDWCPGFFSCFQSVVGFLDYCERNKITGFEIFFQKGLYFDAAVGPNWWEYYFEPIKYGKASDYNEIEYISDILKSHWITETISINMSRERNAEIINKYIKLKPNVQYKIDKFIQHYLNGKYIVGVHYRGTDKSSEAPRVPFDEVFHKINEIIQTISDYKIFVATDEQAFVDYMVSKFGDYVCFIDAHRSLNHDPIHHNQGAPMSFSAALGEEAVIDCYLLSKSHILVRTFSLMSSAAANINPLLTVINLNKVRAEFKQGMELR